MEVTCSRCHQTVQPEDCFCPFCGLPQLVYTADGSAAPGQPERAGEPIRDAATVDWKSALRLAFSLAIPAGALCSMYSPAGASSDALAVDGLNAGRAWVVRLFTCRAAAALPGSPLEPGARIGLELPGFLAAGPPPSPPQFRFYAMRFWLHRRPGSSMPTEN